MDCSSNKSESIIESKTIVRTQAILLCFVVLLMACSTGCTSLISPINAIPAERLPAEFLAAPRANKVDIPLTRLRMNPEREYHLDARDVLGVFIEGELGGDGEQPPVRLPEGDSNLPPAIGYPVAVRDDGTISLPSVPPIDVKGLTIRETEEKIREIYQDEEVLREKARVIVTLMKERTYRVIVVRQDGEGNANSRGQTFSASQGYVLNLPAGKNDVMHALAETGGLPGFNAKNEVKILKANRNNKVIAQDGTMIQDGAIMQDGTLMPNSTTMQDQYIVDQYFEACQSCAINCQPIPALPEIGNFIRIPLRVGCGEMPNFSPEDVVLEDGDILYVESRDAEVFYTGGMLGGGEYQLPRDRDLDVLGAMAMAGQGFGGMTQRSGGGLGGIIGGMGGIPPGELIILRKLPGNRQIPIAVDVNRAINDPSARLLIAPGDTLILRYRPREEITNFALGTFFTYGLRELLR